jgi:hypothetical protein
MKNKYRIVTDKYAGYEVQVKKWFWPFWVETFPIDSFHSVERAEKHIENIKNKTPFKPKVIKYV